MKATLSSSTSFCLLDGLGGTERVIQADQFDLATIDATLIVNHPEIREFRAADCTPRRRGAAVRHGLPDLNLDVGDAGAVFLLRRGKVSYDRDTAEYDRRRHPFVAESH
jgi:hypothetical protein